jgi:hypothetical protein
VPFCFLGERGFLLPTVQRTIESERPAPIRKCQCPRIRPRESLEKRLWTGGSIGALAPTAVRHVRLAPLRVWSCLLLPRPLAVLLAALFVPVWGFETGHDLRVARFFVSTPCAPIFKWNPTRYLVVPRPFSSASHHIHTFERTDRSCARGEEKECSTTCSGESLILHVVERSQRSRSGVSSGIVPKLDFPSRDQVPKESRFRSLQGRRVIRHA